MLVRALAIVAVPLIASVIALTLWPPPKDEINHLERAREAIMKRAITVPREAIAPVVDDPPVIPLVPLPPAQETRAPATTAPINSGFASAKFPELKPIAPLPIPERAPPKRFEPSPPEHQEFICRYPDHNAVRTWFRANAAPILKDCADGAAKGSVIFGFDDDGRASRIEMKGFDDAFVACATPSLQKLTHADLRDMTFTYPVTITSS